MDTYTDSIKAFMAMQMEEQIAESTLASLETNEMLKLLYHYNLDQAIKKAIVNYLVKNRVEDESENQDQDTTNWVNPEQYRTLSEKEQLSEAVLSSIKESDLVTILIDLEISDNVRDMIYHRLISNIRQTSETEPVSDNISSYSNTDRMYPVLNMISTIFKVAAGLIILIGIIIVIVTTKAGYSSLLSASAILFYAVIIAIVVYAFAEMIKVMTDISSTSFQILNQLKQNEKK